MNQRLRTETSTGGVSGWARHTIRRTRFVVTAVGVSVALVLAACGGDDDTATADDDLSAAEGSSGDATDGDAAGAGGDGVLVLDGETIELGAGDCNLEPRDATGGGGSILATAEASGTNAAGVSVNIDFRRNDDESVFHGDNIRIHSSDSTIALSASLDEGDVTVSGSQVSAESIEMTGSSDTGSEAATVSFSIAC